MPHTVFTPSFPIRGNDPRAAEAGIKYILFGAAATAIALFGLSYILASQHTTYLHLLAAKSWAWADSPLAVTGITLFMVGFFFKLALFPFHFWCPDVYDGTSNETAAFAATLPKLGAVVILIRLVALLKPEIEIITIMAVLSAASMTFGNLAALIQTDVKRILGYSSVAHAGYVLVGLVAASAMGLSAAGFYSLIYLLMNLTCFWVICSLSTDGKNLKLDDLNGLYKRAPYLAFVLAVGAFALVGLPPTAGFMGKLFLLTAAWNRGYNWLIIIAALNTAISIYYYLNIVRHAYTQESEALQPRSHEMRQRHLGRGSGGLSPCSRRHSPIRFSLDGRSRKTNDAIEVLCPVSLLPSSSVLRGGQKRLGPTFLYRSAAKSPSAYPDIRKLPIDSTYAQIRLT